jgi:DNA invertase Pin-like site-specific DNA recombinase
MAANERKLLRCAVYTRKSSEHGLEQDFNSLDAQREAAEAYIKSQAHEGWKNGGRPEASSMSGVRRRRVAELGAVSRRQAVLRRVKRARL